MFKKIYDKINAAERHCTAKIFNECDLIRKMIADIRDKMQNINMSALNRMAETINSQQRTIEQLTNALKDKYEHGLFIFSDDCKTPMVIRNGEEVIGKYTKWFRIEWTPGEMPCIETEQIVGTFSDTED